MKKRIALLLCLVLLAVMLPLGMSSAEEAPAVRAQTMTIAQIQKIIPVGLDESQVQNLYSNYAARHARMSNDFIALVRRGARPVLDADNHSEDTPVENMVTSLALMSGYCRLLAEKIVELQDYTADEVIDGQPLPKKTK